MIWSSPARPPPPPASRRWAEPPQASPGTRRAAAFERDREGLEAGTSTDISSRSRHRTAAPATLVASAQCAAPLVAAPQSEWPSTPCANRAVSQWVWRAGRLRPKPRAPPPNEKATQGLMALQKTPAVSAAAPRVSGRLRARRLRFPRGLRGRAPHRWA